MIYINKETELTTEVLQKILNHYNVSVLPKLQKYKNYYDGKQAILDKAYADTSKPCNKTVIGYCKNICDSYCGYIASPSCISYSSDDDITEIMEILKYNDFQAQDADFLLDALIYGVAAELMYIDKDGHTRFRLISPLECFGIYDDTLTGDLLYFVRIYQSSNWDNSNDYYIDVYTDNVVKHYKTQGVKNGYLTFLSEDIHYFSQCPANIFYLPDEKSIFDCIMSLQDSANELLSAEIDDYAEFVNSYLVFNGVDVERDNITQLRENRILALPEGATAQWLTKMANDTQIENMLKRIHDSIYRIAACPDFSSETFVGGVSSGVAIKYRLTGCETRAGKIEAAMKKALQRRIEIICGIASLKLGEEVFRDIDITFKRNIPEDVTSTIAMVNALKGTVSDATLLSQLPFIPDVNEELEALEEQKLKNIDLFAFTPSGSGEDEEETAA